MKDQDRENLYRLFREHGNNLGVARTTVVALNAFIEAVKTLRCTREQVLDLYRELAGAIKRTEPAIVPLIHLMEQFEQEMAAHTGVELDEIRRQAVRILTEKIALFEDNCRKVTAEGLKHVADGDGIIVHSPSAVVTDILVQARTELGRDFKVIVLQQNLVRTRQLINALTAAKIDNVVIPEYNLSHHLGEANKQFIGAVTVTSDRKLIAPPGTANAVHLAHAQNIAVYLFANTLHYSHYPSGRQRIYHAEESRNDGGVRYQMTVHSHDILDLAVIDYVINENGLMTEWTPEQHATG